MEWTDSAVATLERNQLTLSPHEFAAIDRLYDSRRDYKTGIVTHIYTNDDRSMYRSQRHSNFAAKNCCSCNPNAIGVNVFGNPSKIYIGNSGPKVPKWVPFDDDFARIGIISPEFVWVDAEGPSVYDAVEPVAQVIPQVQELRWKVSPGWEDDYERIMNAVK